MLIIRIDLFCKDLNFLHQATSLIADVTIGQCYSMLEILNDIARVCHDAFKGSAQLVDTLPKLPRNVFACLCRHFHLIIVHKVS